MDELQKHLNLHTFEPVFECSSEVFTCNLCGRNLRSRLALDSHHKRYHGTHVKAELKCNAKPSEYFQIFECPNCDQVYIDEDCLKNHLKMKHSAEGKEKKPEVSNVSKTPKRQYPLRSPYFNPNLWLKNELETSKI
ncbi:uncharacterized protein Dwil_GK27572 [Drosophila willistoni]|nr:uncharacterized protein Dwil_GK27572 [Drosophila willistoni]